MKNEKYENKSMNVSNDKTDKKPSELTLKEFMDIEIKNITKNTERRN